MGLDFMLARAHMKRRHRRSGVYRGAVYVGQRDVCGAIRDMEEMAVVKDSLDHRRKGRFLI